jgi:ABC-type nitrate/sulfonate/bicarbonate transport system substrate-binding protein
MRARTACLAAFALAGCGATGGADRPERDATLMLDGPRAGVHAGIASALARGYDDAEGVHLKLLRGSATPSTLTTGRATFAVLDLNELAGRRDVVAVMAIVQRPLLAFTSRGRIRAPWAKRFGRPVARWDLAPPSGARRVEDAGVPAYPELVLAVARENLTDEPSVVRATVAALTRGYRFALDDPESSEQDLGRPGSLDRLDAAFLGDGGRPGLLDTREIARYARWAHTTFSVHQG